MCSITGLSLRFHAITVKFSSKYYKNTSQFYNMLCSLHSYAWRHSARVLRKQSGPQPDLDIWWRHLHLQNGAHAEPETRGKVTPWLFAAPRSVLSPYYFESCDFRQWEIRGVKKKCRPMNVCAFLGGKTTEHESFSAQRNARQGAKHPKTEGECHFLDLWKNFFWNLHKICLLIVVCLV